MTIPAGDGAQGFLPPGITLEPEPEEPFRHEYIALDPLEDLFLTLYNAYTATEKPALTGLLNAFVDAHGPALSAVQAEHSPDAQSYVEPRDWVYATPEFLMIAERTVTRPFKLRAALEHSDFEPVISPMIDAIRSAVRSSDAERRA